VDTGERVTNLAANLTLRVACVTERNRDAVGEKRDDSLRFLNREIYTETTVEIQMDTPCGCRKRVRVFGELPRCWSRGVWRGSRRVEADALVGLADVGVSQAAWRYSLMSPPQVGCRRIG
jgi:hypothetical protein